MKQISYSNERACEVQTQRDKLLRLQQGEISGLIRIEPMTNGVGIDAGKGYSYVTFVFADEVGTEHVHENVLTPYDFLPRESVLVRKTESLETGDSDLEIAANLDSRDVLRVNFGDGATHQLHLKYMPVKMSIWLRAADIEVSASMVSEGNDLRCCYNLEYSQILWLKFAVFTRDDVLARESEYVRVGSVSTGKKIPRSPVSLVSFDPGPIEHETMTKLADLIPAQTVARELSTEQLDSDYLLFLTELSRLQGQGLDSQRGAVS